ncbi:MAG: hypothetical protein RXO36_03695 [Candidatus Nanopusillus acidilobi]
MELKVGLDSFDGKQFFYGYLNGYRVYVNHQLVEKIGKHNSQNPQSQVYTIELPINGCDIVEIDNSTLVIVPGNKTLYFFRNISYDIIDIECEDCTSYSKSKDTSSALILASDKVKLHCQYTVENDDEDETKNMVVLLHPDGRVDYIPDEKILEYV